MPQRTDSLHPVDPYLLETLQERRLEYPAVVGVDVGVHPAFAAKRLESLQERGFVEAVTPETVYRVTARGRQFLEAHGSRAVAVGSD